MTTGLVRTPDSILRGERVVQNRIRSESRSLVRVLTQVRRYLPTHFEEHKMWRTFGISFLDISNS